VNAETRGVGSTIANGLTGNLITRVKNWARRRHSRRDLVFFHVPRTGGLTCRNILQQIYPDSFRYCKTADVTEIRKLLKERGCLEFHSGELNGKRIYFHQNIILPENWKYFRDTTMFIMFRNPVDRLVSHYFQILDSRNNPRVVKLFRRMDVPFPETIDDFIKLPYVHNIQVGFLAGYHFSSKKIHTARELQLAKEFLISPRVTIGITEKFGDSIGFLENALGRSIPIRDIEIKNQHSFRNDVLRINSATREFIREKNQLDEDLYQFAYHLFKKQFESLRIVLRNDLRFHKSL